MPVTAGTGLAEFQYIPPEISGVEIITVEVTDEEGTLTTATAPIIVKLDGFQLLGNDSYELVGRDDLFNDFLHTYPARHWATSRTASMLAAAANRYIDLQSMDSMLQQTLDELQAASYDFPESSRLPLDIFQVNDVSLPWGGLFDLNGNFAAPHGGHRWGNAADIRTRDLVTTSEARGEVEAVGDPRPTYNALVKRAHFRQFQLMGEALRDAQSILRREGGQTDHWHVRFYNLP